MIIIEEIKTLANDIDNRINLFEGYVPKETVSYKGELLFWRLVVNVYGLLADCDPVQIKANRNLLDMMSRYNLIGKTDYKLARKFWQDVSDLRKWFCHNNNPNLYYKRKQEMTVRRYLQTVFLIASNKPEYIEKVPVKDWNVLAADVERRFQEYLQILKKGLCTWKGSSFKEDLIDEWIDIFSIALFNDRELINNVLADIAEYNIRNQNLRNVPIPQLGKSYARALEKGEFSAEDIKNELKSKPGIKRSSREIVAECIQNSGLI